MPAKFMGMVHTSIIYMAKGHPFSPVLKATEGDVGAASNHISQRPGRSPLTKVRTFKAFK